MYTPFPDSNSVEDQTDVYPKQTIFNTSAIDFIGLY